MQSFSHRVYSIYMYYTFCLGIFAIIAYMIVVDENVGKYIYLRTKLLLIEVRKRAWMTRLWLRLQYDRYTLSRALDKRKKL